MASPLLARQPTALGLARLSRRPVFPPGGENLYRQIARLVELSTGQELLVVPCASGVTAQFLVSSTGASGAGADPDPELIALAEQRARATGLAERVHYDEAPLDDLPYTDAVFDVAIGEIGLGAAVDPARAVLELARVTKPLGTVVLIQLVWTQQLEPERREAVVERLGVRPFLLVEWKQMLRDAGVVELRVEDWSASVAEARGLHLPIAGLAEFASLRDKLALLVLAWKRWGWRGMRQLVRRGDVAGRLATGERLLGLSVIRGTKWQTQAASGA